MKGLGLSAGGGVSSIMMKGGIGIRGLGVPGLASQFFHKPLSKMSSLPDNFIFRGHRGSDPGIRGNALFDYKPILFHINTA